MISPSTAATTSRTPIGVMLLVSPSALVGSVPCWQRHTQSRSVVYRQLSWLPSMHGMQVLTSPRPGQARVQGDQGERELQQPHHAPPHRRHESKQSRSQK